MGVSWAQAQQNLEQAIKRLFGADPRVRSVGVARHGAGFGFRAVRNSALPLKMAGLPPPPIQVANVPVVYSDAPGDVQRVVKLPTAGPGSAGLSSLVPEQLRHRPLVCGLQIQNFTDDARQAVLPQYMNVGTLGCFVRTSAREDALVSNNHVIAGENRGRRGADVILQPGGTAVGGDQVAALADYIDLQISPAGASVAVGTAVLNEVDAALAKLSQGVNWMHAYLAARQVKDPTTGAMVALRSPSGTAAPALGDRVFKVGRTTGLTHGEITDVSTTVGPVPYDPGDCWFKNCFTIIEPNGGTFCDRGDSGSAIINEATGKVVGLLFASNGTDTYACPIVTVLSLLNCTLV
ncbi:MAG TPA: hypothetical protein VMS17_03280 [Gemmataceae bacterium]|nr:hypothetical protein [Gemmataceae bacterium]